MDEKNSDIRVMPKNMYGLSEFNIGIKKNIQIWEGCYETRDAKTIFIPYNECTKEQQKLIDEKRKKLDKFKKIVSQDKSQKYDKPGSITLPVYRQRDDVKEACFHEIGKIVSGEKSEQDYLTEQDSITISITQRQLADVGLLPEDYRWKEDERAQVSEKDIAEADEASKLTPSDIGIGAKFFNFIKSKVKGEK